MSGHENPHPLAGQTVALREIELRPGIYTISHETFRVEDWWDRIAGKSWTVSDSNPAAMCYGLRVGMSDLPLDDEVLYGKINGLGHLVHVTELAGDL